MQNTSNVKFVRISEAVKLTGLSKYFFRNGIKENTIPYIRSGNTFYINLPALLQQIEKQSMEVVK